jgi:hypothetical protein
MADKYVSLHFSTPLKHHDNNFISVVNIMTIRVCILCKSFLVIFQLKNPISFHAFAIIYFLWIIWIGQLLSWFCILDMSPVAAGIASLFSIWPFRGKDRLTNGYHVRSLGWNFSLNEENWLWKYVNWDSVLLYTKPLSKDGIAVCAELR